MPFETPEERLLKIAQTMRLAAGEMAKVLDWLVSELEPLAEESRMTLLIPTGFIRDGVQSESERKPLSFEVLAETVARFTNVTPEELVSQSRARRVVIPRQVSMFVMYNYTHLSYPAVGDLFGGRDHTTVVHAVAKIRKQRYADPNVRDLLELLITTLRLTAITEKPKPPKRSRAARQEETLPKPKPKTKPKLESSVKRDTGDVHFVPTKGWGW